MCDLKNSSMYTFYMKFNLMSTWLVGLLPFILLGINLIFDTRPDICDTVNDFLFFFTIFALMILNLKQSSEIVGEENSDEES